VYGVVARSRQHISKSKCAKHTNLGTLLEVDMSKKCAPLWREAHLDVYYYYYYSSYSSSSTSSSYYYYYSSYSSSSYYYYYYF